MYTMTGFKTESRFIPTEDEFEYTEVVDFTLTDVIGYSFGTHSVAAQFADGSAEIRFTDGLSRITLSAPKREEEPAKAANEEPADLPDNVVSIAPAAAE